MTPIEEVEIIDEYDDKYGLDNIGAYYIVHYKDEILPAMKAVLDGKREPIKPGEFAPKVPADVQT